MKKINWLTKADVKKAAAAGRKQAILSCHEHWTQLTTATIEQLYSLSSNYKDNIVWASYCAMCLRYNPYTLRFRACHKNCPLKCRKVWIDAKNRFEQVLSNPNRQTLFLFRIAARRVLKKIEDLYGKLYHEKI